METERKLELFIIRVGILFRESSSGIVSGREGWVGGTVVYNWCDKLNAQLLEINSHAVCCDLMVRAPDENGHQPAGTASIQH